MNKKSWDIVAAITSMATEDLASLPVPSSVSTKSILTQDQWEREMADYNHKWVLFDAIQRQERLEKIREIQRLMDEIEVQEGYLEWLDWVIDLLKRELKRRDK